MLFGIKTGWQAAEQPLWGWCCPAQGRAGHLPLPCWAERTVLYLFGVDKGHSLLQLPAVSIPGFAGCHGLAALLWAC